MAVLPTGAVTFLFTDIEGSTHLLQKLGPSWADVLATHCDLLRSAVSGAGGIEFGNEGDALFFVFEGAGDAVAGALAGQRAIDGHRWPEGHRVRVRMGMHSGEATLTRGGTYVGLALHQAARICSAGHGGQVVLTSATAKLAAERMPDGTSLVDLGHHRLRDLPDPLHLFQLAHPDLAERFPRLRSDAAPGNLPKQITRFVGRSSLVEAAVRQLTAGASLLTFTGAGGAGKTRLALEVAAEVVDTVPHGAWLVELASLTDGSLVAQTVAAALDVREEPGLTVVESLAASLADKRLLLLLDNCEHVVAEAADLVGDLLAACPGLQVVVASQEALGITGEVTVRVPPLPAAEGVELFVDRARLHRPDFELNDDTAAAVDAICGRLDGIPLAIELAAARVAVLSPRQIADRLDDQFRLLTGGSRTALPRHRTLRAAVDWSFSLLGADEQRLLCSLAVFPGPFSLDAVEAVCDGDLDLLSRLVARSLVVVEEQDLEARYHLLESIRQYAEDKLADEGRLAELRRALVGWCAELVTRAEAELSGPAQATWFGRLDREYDLIRAALGWAEPADLLEMSADLWRFWLVRGHWNEGLSWLDRALSFEGGRPMARARALAAAGDLATEQGDLARSQSLLEEALELWRSLDDIEGVARALNHLGNLARMRGEFDTARGFLSEALGIRRAAGNDRATATSLRNLGVVAARQRDTETARSYYREALPLARSSGDSRVVASLTALLAQVAFADGESDEAMALADEGLALAREVGDRRLTAEHLTILAGLASAAGDDAGATTRFEEALVIWRSLDAPDAVAWLHTVLGEMALAAGGVEVAWRHLEEARQVWTRLGDEPQGAAVAVLAGQVACMTGRLDEADELLHGAEDVAARLGDAALASAASHGLGEVARLRGRWDEAAGLYERALLEADATGWRRLRWGPVLGLAVVARHQGRYDEAHELLRQSIALRPGIGRRLGTAGCLDEVAAVLAETGKPAAAAQLLGAASSLRRSAGAARLPVNVEEHEGLVASLRTRLGDDVYDAAWHRGAALGADEAVALALE